MKNFFLLALAAMFFVSGCGSSGATGEEATPTPTEPQEYMSVGGLYNLDGIGTTNQWCGVYGTAAEITFGTGANVIFLQGEDEAGAPNSFVTYIEGGWNVVNGALDYTGSFSVESSADENPYSETSYSGTFSAGEDGTAAYYRGWKHINIPAYGCCDDTAPCSMDISFEGWKDYYHSP